MNSAKKLSQPLSDPNIDSLEPLTETRRRQRDILTELKRVKRMIAVGLKHCSASRCGKDRCREVCAFGARRRRRKAIPATYRLLKNAGGPVFEVRVSPDAWFRNPGDLDTTSMMAARQLNRRSLDAVLNPNVVAVGCLKAYSMPGNMQKGWHLEIHQIVAGVERVDFARVFGASLPRYYKSVSIEEIDDLSAAVSRVFQQDLRMWRSATGLPEPSRPKRKARAEYYQWQLPMRCGALTIRYGCDRHFNRLKKVPKTVRPKVRKGHPYPTWLEPYQFGTDTRERMNDEKFFTSQLAAGHQCPIHKGTKK